jgi:mono/diheme cytochrome c family protein
MRVPNAEGKAGGGKVRPERWAVAVAVVILSANPARAGHVDYARDVKPLLAKHCVSCHGAARPRGGLKLDTAANALRGGKDGPSVVPGKADESPLILALTGDGSTERMPLKRPPLSEVEITTLRAWVDAGAPHPADEAPSLVSVDHWAFTRPQRPHVPPVREPSLVENPIDAFILARLDAEGVAPSPEADRRTLARRVSLDLIGLPPTPEEVEAFAADDSPEAYGRLVDRLLASPRFGERWARPWLDLARYADSNGYSIDAPRTIYKYRDWVIDALNRDMPFDEFVIDQIAGDLRPGATLGQKVATGFHRNTMINQEGGIDLEQFRVEAVVDRVNTTATAFLGLTLGCAQCHDHKYDPVSQREYYRLFAFFNNNPLNEPVIEFATPDELARRDAVRAEIAAWHDRLKQERPEVLGQEREWEKSLKLDFKQALAAELKDAFDRRAEQRSESQWRGLVELYLKTTSDHPDLAASIASFRAREPHFETSMVLGELPTPRATYIHLGGDFTRHGETVTPGVPAVLSPLQASDPERLDRMDLARWLVDPANPLTARVTVNRVWQAYFGKGLVETENDFGTQGTPPSHPELLDWLATEFVGRGWSVKAIHRLIVTSRTYRQSSHARSDLDRVDPYNRLLARQSRLRIDAEAVRDASLAVSGLLASRVGGPSVFPPQPDGVMTLGQMKRPWEASAGPDRYRRGLYTFFWRATPHPALTVFDAPNAIQSCTRRNRSNTPLQALTLLNDQAFVECARSFAALVAAEPGRDDDGRLAGAFLRALGRPPSDRESATLARLLDAERADLGEGPAAERAAWAAVARVLLNTDEFITRE